VPKLSWRKNVLLVGGCLTALSALSAFQLPFRQFHGVEYREFELPEDWKDSGEWAFARLMFPPGPNDGYRGRFDGDWRLGLSLWTQDYPRADRHFSLAVRRLTRLHVRSVEQPVNLDEGDDVYNWPWLYAVQVGEWGLTDKQGQALREYCLRGGFFFADDFHGQDEYYEFESRIKKAFPEYNIVDIDDADPIFHAVYDLNDRYQIPGQAHLRAGYKSNNGTSALGAKWKAIMDEKGRIMVAITYNSDVGDAWEYADDPWYPERFSDLAIRVGVNYIVYAMSH